MKHEGTPGNTVDACEQRLRPDWWGLRAHDRLGRCPLATEDLYNPRTMLRLMAPHAMGLRPRVYTQYGFENARWMLGAASGFEERLRHQTTFFNQPMPKEGENQPTRDEIRHAVVNNYSFASPEDGYVWLNNQSTGTPAADDDHSRLLARGIAFHELGHLVQQIAEPRPPLGPDLPRLVRSAVPGQEDDWALRAEDLAGEHAVALGFRHAEECFADAFATGCLLHDGRDSPTAIRAYALAGAVHGLDSGKVSMRAARLAAGFETRDLDTIDEALTQGVYLTLRCQLLALSKRPSIDANERLRDALRNARRGALPLDMVVAAGAGAADHACIFDDETLAMIEVARKLRGERPAVDAEAMRAMGVVATDGVNAILERLIEAGGPHFMFAGEEERAISRGWMAAWCDTYLGQAGGRSLDGFEL